MLIINRDKGFTLIELLVVIAIIGIFSSVILINVNSAREKTRIARVRVDLQQILNAMNMLASDTGKWPNGCPAWEWENPEVYIDDPWAGITSIISSPGTPSIQSGYTKYTCTWTAEDLANWRGPYMKGSIRDPWGNRYLFDPDYCDENGNNSVAILSMGPNGMEEYKSNCGLLNNFTPSGPPPGDDIVLYPESSKGPVP